jgi:diguanylate cyclase (GGDEF)-like protein
VVTEPAVQSATPASVLAKDSPLRVLLIEDSLPDSELVLAVLEAELPQMEVVVVDNLNAALALATTTTFDAVLADLSLPDSEGRAIVAAVRHALPDTALLVLTSRVDGQLALWALSAGAQDYLIKGQNDGPGLATALLHALQRHRTEQEAHRYLRLSQDLLDALDAPTCAVGSDSRIVAVNESWRAFMRANGGSPESCGEGNSYLLACDQADPASEGAVIAGEVATGLRGVLSGEMSRYQQSYPCHTAGVDRWFSVRMTPAAVDGTGGGAVISHVDVSDMHAVQQALAHQALHDSLTGLPNRLLLTDRLSQALLDRDRRGGDVAVAFVDLDRFKRVNDSFGHPIGDALLVEVAQRLTQRIRATDTLARLSGDEFVVIWRDLGSPEEATFLSERLGSALREPYHLGGDVVDISASIGVVVGRNGDGVEQLLHASDAAMYEAKRLGGGRVHVFSDELRGGIKQALVAEDGLRTALARHELVLHYQPVIDLTTGRAVAVEALVRWDHPEQGLLGPVHFIPIAESSGLIIPLGRWVLEQACRDAAMASGPAAGLDVAVNLSVHQLIQSDVVMHVTQALEHSGLAPERLMLEVTESAVMEDAEAAALTLDALSRLGVSIAIDDFGTGYSSLLYLRLCPITALKLDRAFVSGIGLSADDEAICGSVVGLAHAVGATSIAEGVETMEQYAALRGLGCQQAQGFLWSPAVALEELDETLVRISAMSRPAPKPLAAAAVVPLPVQRHGGTSTDEAATGPSAAAISTAHKTAEVAETARGETAIAVAVAAELTAETAAQTALAVQRQADASASKVADAASAAAAAVAASVSDDDPAATLVALRLAAIVTAAAMANAEETAAAAAIVARAVAAAAADTALTASTQASAREQEVSDAAAAVRAAVADDAGDKHERIEAVERLEA